MKKLIITLLLSTMSLLVQAEEALSKTLIENYFGATNQIAMLDMEDSDALDDILMLEREEVISTITSLDVYPQIASIIETSGFDNITEFVDIGYRVIGSMYAVQLEKHPELVQMQNFTTQVEAQIASMKAQGMPASVIEEMEAEVKMQKKSIAAMSKAAENASRADKAFVNANFGWLMSTLPGIEE